MIRAFKILGMNNNGWDQLDHLITDFSQVQRHIEIAKYSKEDIHHAFKQSISNKTVTLNDLHTSSRVVNEDICYVDGCVENCDLALAAELVLCGLSGPAAAVCAAAVIVIFATCVVSCEVPCDAV